ncbi:hypothetical protein KRP22_006894 [Phytophthora ramorum]|nr:hypothetical protein KRP22_1972 [Phytophthora ramorum]
MDQGISKSLKDHYQTMNAGTCCGICNNSFSWSNRNGGMCWLKNAKEQTASKAGVVSSQILDNPPPSCAFETIVDYLDNDIGNELATKLSDILSRNCNCNAR